MKKVLCVFGIMVFAGIFIVSGTNVGMIFDNKITRATLVIKTQKATQAAASEFTDEQLYTNRAGLKHRIQETFPKTRVSFLELYIHFFPPTFKVTFEDGEKVIPMEGGSIKFNIAPPVTLGGQYI